MDYIYEKEYDLCHIGSKSNQTESNYVFKALQQSLIHGLRTKE